MLARSRASRFAVATAALLALAPAALAKPLFLLVERELDDAVLIAEARILDVEIADWLGEGGRRGRLRAQVTADPTRIYRGARYLARQLELHSAPAGPQSCTAELNRIRGSGTTVLLVVDADHVVRLAGTEVEDKQAYRLRGWCDYNACLLRTDRPDLGEGSGRAGSNRFDIAREKLRALYRQECVAFWGTTARFLADETPATDPAEITHYIETLTHGDAARREAAQEQLVQRGVLHVARIREAARTTTDPEARRCLDHVLRRLQASADAHDAAVSLAGAPLAARIHVVQWGLESLDGESAASVRNYLQRLETERGSAAPPDAPPR